MGILGPGNIASSVGDIILTVTLGGLIFAIHRMPQIRLVSDLRNNFAAISKLVHETAEPVLLTKNGYGDMVVMSIEAYERKLFESNIYIS